MSKKGRNLYDDNDWGDYVSKSSPARGKYKESVNYSTLPLDKSFYDISTSGSKSRPGKYKESVDYSTLPLDKSFYDVSSSSNARRPVDKAFYDVKTSGSGGIKHIVHHHHHYHS
jgi:hypothetical protein